MKYFSFLGAGASIPAGVSGVKGMVTKFIKKLQGDQRDLHLKVIRNVVDLLSSWKNGSRDVDIELLLETIEKLENRNSEVMPLFYIAKSRELEEFEKLEAETDMKLSVILKQFVKAETGKVDLQTDYLKGLLTFMKFHKPLHIFSTNYDVCIERFGELNHKSCFDGFFDGRWDATKFNNIDKDLYLHKLHGSVTWSRDEKGKYTRNEIAIIDTAEPQTNIVSGEKEVPLISYPGRKLEYFEPLFDLLEELKKRLNDSNMKYIFVIGYSFRDDHLRRLFQYAAEKNHEFILFLVSPSSHKIYQENLKNYKDIDFIHAFSDKFSKHFNRVKTSSLSGRVICLPYKIENIIDSLNDVYLVELKSGLAHERIEGDKCENGVGGWYECLKHFVACEYFDKVRDILDKRMGGLDALMKSDYNLYKLGWEIILKSFLNMMFLDNERSEWSQIFKKYLIILASNIEVKIDSPTKSPYIKFKYSEDQPAIIGSDIHGLFKHLSENHDTHPIFLNDNAPAKTNLVSINISEMLNYLSMWRNNTVSLHDYIKLREDKYTEDIIRVRNFAENTSPDINDCIHVLREIEKKELLGLSLRTSNEVK